LTRCSAKAHNLAPIRRRAIREDLRRTVIPQAQRPVNLVRRSPIFVGHPYMTAKKGFTPKACEVCYPFLPNRDIYPSVNVGESVLSRAILTERLLDDKSPARLTFG